jgi:hypothetical protein
MNPTVAGPDALRATLDALYEDGYEHFHRFEQEVRRSVFHPFVPADYADVEGILRRHLAPGRRFLEWGSGSGVITIMADLLGFEAYGIELDGSLVDVARTLAERYRSKAQFVAASFLPEGYHYRDEGGGTRTGTLGSGPSGYLALGRSLEDFEVVFGYPWHGEEPVMRDVFRRYGSPDATLIVYPGGTRPAFQRW